MRYSAAAALVLVPLVAAPWAFASIESYYALIVALACLVPVTGLLVAEAATGPAEPPLPRIAACALLALPLLVGACLVPLPGALVGLLAPRSSELFAAAGVDQAGWRPLSLQPVATWHALFLTAAAAGVFWVVARAAANPARARWITRVILLGGVLLAAFALVQRLVNYQSQMIYWTVELPEVGTPFGPYVNRNLFGGLMVLLAGLAAGALGAAFEERRRGRAVILGGVLALLLVTALATTSRGAVLGLAAATLTVLVGAPRGRRKRLLLTLVVIGVLAVVALAAIGLLSDFAGRLFHLYGRWRARFLVQGDALAVFTDFPLFGVGPGTFAEVYPVFQRIEPARHFSHPHSDWVMFLFETGVAGVATCALVLVAVARPIVQRVRSGRGVGGGEAGLWPVLGPAAGCVGVCAHGLVSINLHVPANALLFAATLSLAYAAARRPAPASDRPGEEEVASCGDAAAADRAATGRTV